MAFKKIIIKKGESYENKYERGSIIVHDEDVINV